MLLDAAKPTQAVASATDAAEAVRRLEAEILKHPQVEMPVAHEHCDGVYARSMFIPAGTIATGAVHRGESFFVVRMGTLIAHTSAGPMEFQPGHMTVTKPGDKRAVIAVTDVIVTTFHANPDNETDPQALWDRFTISAPETMLEQAAAPALEYA
jgi:quercetin dioxygenase-like cupin family protein